MHSLREIQVAFQEYLLTQHKTIHAEIIATNQVSVQTRLDIYREAYYLRLLEVLQSDYEILHTLLGDEEFDQLGRAYINAHPSLFRSVSWFGKHLPAFIKKNQQPFLSELAQFEWLLTESFDAENAPTVTIEQMATIPAEKWPELYFELDPSVRTCDVNWNVLQIWNAANTHDHTVSPQKIDKKTTILIWRKDLDIQFYSLSEEQTDMLNAITAGHNFGAICESLCKWTDENTVGMLAAQLLKQFILDGILSRIIFK